MMQDRRRYVWMMTIAAAAVVPVTAAAAPADSAASRSDSRERRLVRIERSTSDSEALPFTYFKSVRAPATTPLAAFQAMSDAEAKAAPEWSASFTLPVTYNSNPEHAGSHADGDGHADPTLRVRFANPVKDGLITLSGSVDSDFNFDRPANDSGTLALGAKYELKTRRLGGLVPYAKYGFLDIYDGTFESHAVSLHNFSAGATYESVSGKAGKEVTFDATFDLTRREASSRAAEQNRATADLEWSGAFRNGVGWDVDGTVQYRDYTGGANKSRTDVNLSATVSLTWKLKDNLSLAMTAQLERNESDAAGKDYTAWDVGPSLIHKF